MENPKMLAVLYTALAVFMFSIALADVLQVFMNPSPDRLVLGLRAALVAACIFLGAQHVTRAWGYARAWRQGRQP